MIDRTAIYEIENYKFQNFVMLDDGTIENIRIWRNNPDIRKYMYDTGEISKEQHLRFIKSLPSRDDIYYWLVYKDGKPLGVVNIIEYDEELAKAQTGYYMLPEYLNSGNGLEFISVFNLFVFDKLKLKQIYGRTELRNKNALMTNYHLGSRFHSELTTINGELFVEQELNASDFIGRYDTIADTKSLMKSLREFKVIYKELKSIKNGN